MWVGGSATELWLYLFPCSSPQENSQGTDRSGHHRSARGGPPGEHANHIGAGEWGIPGPGSTTSGSPASAQTPLYANAPSAGLLAKLQVGFDSHP